MKIVFMGTPEFSVPSLEELIKEFKVEAVFTQPDRPKGRGKKMSVSPIKEVALKNNILVYQPVNIKKDEECVKILKDMCPDFIIVVAYGQILSKEILHIPKYGCINLHASLLPKYRGAAPINWAIIKGEKKSGNTTMFMAEGLDTGDILLKSEFEIDETMTAGELHDILMKEGAKLLVKTIKSIAEGSIKPEKQDDSKSCYASMLDKKMAKINWNKTNMEINNLIKGLNPWPIAYTQYIDKNMKIHEACVINEESKFNPGHIVSVSKDGVKVQCGQGMLLITKLQFPGSKSMKVKDYINGHEIKTDIVLK